MGAVDRFDCSVLPARHDRARSPTSPRSTASRRPSPGSARARSPRTASPSTRLQLGCYGQRQPGVNMLRVKAPGGKLNAGPARRDRRGRRDRTRTADQAHVTTRESIQIHSVPLGDTPNAMRILARAGLTTREACDNTVRNISACGMAGACPLEHTDVNQHLDARGRALPAQPAEPAVAAQVQDQLLAAASAIARRACCTTSRSSRRAATASRASSSSPAAASATSRARRSSCARSCPRPSSSRRWKR